MTWRLRFLFGYFLIVVSLFGCNRSEFNSSTGKPSNSKRDVGRKQNEETEAVPYVIPVITSSARGWNVKVKRSRMSKRPDTIVVSPGGHEFNAGKTGIPDYHQPIVWLLKVQQLDAQFLLIYLCPTASGSTSISLLLIRGDRVISKAAQIAHHFEWDKSTSVDQVTAALFEDADGDGVLELVEPDVGKFGGTITYHEFDGTRFRPLWRKWHYVNY